MQEDRVLVRGDFYKHFKDKLYQIREIATHSESKEKMVVYQAMYGDFQVYVRPYEMFMSEVDHNKYPDVKQKYRFEKVDVDSIHFNLEQTEFKNTTINNVNKSLSPEKTLEEKQEEKQDENQEGAIDPNLLMFLDAKNYQEKLNVLTLLRNKLNDRLINDIAISLDLTVEEGPIDKRYDSLRSGLLAHAKFECNRLR